MLKQMFIPLSKVDEEQRLVFGVATAEQPDKSGEVCDYASTVPYYKEWSATFEKNTDGKSLGNVRAMHGDVAAGKITQITFNDEAKQIEICAKIVDDAEWKKVQEGVYTGFSQGGEYVKQWRDPSDNTLMRYTARPVEVSIVDNPCLGASAFQYVKSNGEVEMRKFHTAQDEKTLAKKLAQVWECTDGSTHATKAEAVKKQAEIDAEAAAKEQLSGVIEATDALKAEVAKREEEGKTEGDTAPAADPAPAEEVQKAEAAKAEKAAKKAEMFSGLSKYMGEEVFDAGQALSALETVMSLLIWEMNENESMPDQISALQTVVERLKAFIASEIQEDNTDPAMKAEGAGDLEKKGAKHSKETAEHISAIHSAASSIMEKCMILGAGAGNPSKADQPDEDAQLAKVQAEAKDAAMKKMVDGLTDTIQTLQKRLQALEAQPAPAKGAIFAVEKGHEVHPAGKEPVEAHAQATDTIPNGVSPAEARARMARQ